jgi:hypothetical protein
MTRVSMMKLVGFGLAALLGGLATASYQAPTPSLDKVYADESHCLTDSDMRGDQDLPLSCWCRDALVDLRYVYATYVDVSSPKHDANMDGPLLQLYHQVYQSCGHDAYNPVTVRKDSKWQWPGPEVVRTYPPDEVIARIQPEQRKDGKWRGRPFTVQLVFRDGQGHVTRTENYSRVAWEPCVAGVTKPPCK